MHDGEGGDPALIGEAAHIVALNDDGPRGDPDFPQDQRNRYSNLMLLCRNHHRLVDQQEEEYPVDTLHGMKRGHEEWVRASLEVFDSDRQRDDERYAAIVEEWGQRCGLDAWQAWTSNVLAADPTMSKERFHALDDLVAWLLGRVWPGRYDRLERSFTNFRLVLQDLVGHFAQHREEAPDLYWIRRFYRIQEWNPERYHALLEEFEEYLDLLHDLTLELTRAANRICDDVRQFVDPGFRLDEGVLLVSRMISVVDPVQILRTEYRGDEIPDDRPYRGLDAFRQDRFNRDFRIAPEPDEEVDADDDANGV